MEPLEICFNVVLGHHHIFMMLQFLKAVSKQPYLVFAF